MHTLYPLCVRTLVTAIALLGMSSPLFARSSWSDAGFSTVSRPSDCWYEPEKASLQRANSNYYSWTDIGLEAFVGADNFRGIPDYDNGDNHGVLAGLNVATPIPYLKRHGVGFQLGGSYGAYDFAGRSSPNNKEIQSQGFLSVGLFIRPQPCTPLSLGIAYDWMFNKNFSIYAEDPTIEQLRAQIAYFLTASDEIGIWGTYDTSTAHKLLKCGWYDSQMNYRAISQANVFWRHIFEGGTESNVWVGTTTKHRLNRQHSDHAGKFIVGVELTVPFLDSWALLGRACYMQPGTKRGAVGSREYTSNIAVNLVYYFGGDSNNTESVSSAAWMPYLPLANNSNFMVDAATTFIDRY